METRSPTQTECSECLLPVQISVLCCRVPLSLHTVTCGLERHILTVAGSTTRLPYHLPSLLSLSPASHEWRILLPCPPPVLRLPPHIHTCPPPALQRVAYLPNDSGAAPPGYTTSKILCFLGAEPDLLQGDLVPVVSLSFRSYSPSVLGYYYTVFPYIL